MFDYRPRGWQPHARVGQAIVAPPVVAPSAPAVIAPSGAPAAPAGMPVPEGIFWTALAAAAAYASIRTATRPKEKTWSQVAGWAGGTAAGLGALFGLLGIAMPGTARNFPIRWYWVA